MSATAVAAPSLAPARVTQEAQAARIAEHLPQVQRIARAIYRRLPKHVVFEDLVQAGTLGLIDALQKFDPEKHVQFGAYASFRIQGAILDSLRELDWAPRELRKQARRLEDAELRLYSRLGRTADEIELAREMRMNLSDFRELRAELNSLEVASLDAPLPGEEHVDLASQLSDSGPTPYEDFRDEEVKRLLAAAIRQLPQREHHVLALYYFEELTMKEVGRVLGVDESRVSQIHSAAMARLSAGVRAAFDEADLRP